MDLITLSGKLLLSEESPNDSSNSLIASAIVSADLIDRLVFARGVFQPVVAYCTLARLKKAPAPFMHPLVLGCIIKILAESVTSPAINILGDRRLRASQHFLKVADSITDDILSSSEEKVAISQLAPGMRITQPVVTFDGKELLDESMELDHDQCCPEHLPYPD